MLSITENINIEKNFNKTIQWFFSMFKVGRALRAGNAYKTRGFSIVSIMHYLVMLVFTHKSMYRDSVSEISTVGHSSDAIYRFLRSASVNWTRVLLEISINIAAWLRQLTSEDRCTALVLDDTLYERPNSKKTELVSKVFDHNDRKYKRGFRSLFLGWTDGATFIPVAFRHIASTNPDNVYVSARSGQDRRTNAAKAKKEATMKSTDVALRMLKDAKRFGFPARHVLFDSWFSFPTFIEEVCALGYRVVCRLKKNKTLYLVEGKWLNLKEIYNVSKKRRGRSHYLLSVAAGMKKSTSETMNIRIVFVRNKAKSKDWIAFLSTDIDMSEDDIIKLYGKRWGIEVFFKTCKSFLRFTGEFQQTSYEAITAHTAVVAIRQMILAVEQRMSTDQRRTPGDIFFYISDEAKDVSFEEALTQLLKAMMVFVGEYGGLGEDQLNELVNDFLSTLPFFLRQCLLIKYRCTA